MARVLVIEDNDTLRRGMEATLLKAGYEVRVFAGGKEAVEQLQSIEPNCVVSDLRMAGMDGIAILKAVKNANPGVPVMIITAFGTIEKAVEAMKLGAFDFITKPFPPDLLRVKVKQAVEHERLSAEKEKLYFENEYLRKATESAYANKELLGTSPAIKKIHTQIKKIAGTDASIFIVGESGTGKELVARAIHENSARQGNPFIKVNCGALAEGVLESELFGHEKGAFTGAVRRKPGRFELANGGTLLLDEIGDINENIQLKLLRVLQEKEFERVGGTQTIKVNVRIISATNQDLRALVDKGVFREDLYYRLVIVPLHIPPLRERRSDIPILVDAFLERLNRRLKQGVKILSKEAMAVLKRYAWPGNVRELQNLLEQLYILTDGDTIELSNLPNFLNKSGLTDNINGSLGEMSLPEILDQTERHLIEAAQRQTGGVKTQMAKLLGIKTSALYYKLEKYGLLQTSRSKKG